MEGLFEWYSRVKEYYRFTPREIKELLLSAIIYGFILSFRMWGSNEVNYNDGITNWLLAGIFVFIVMVWNISWQKIFALYDGYKVHYYWFFPGSIIGLFISFLTFGFVPFLYPGNTIFEHVKRLRLGRFRHGINHKDMAVASIAGVVSNIALALIFSFFYVLTNNNTILFFMKINFIFAFFSMLPLPRFQATRLGGGATPGFHIFYFARPLYTFIFASILIYSVLIYLAATAWLSISLLVISAALGCLFMLGFNKFIYQL